jgi:hypothetical protein
MNSPSAAKPTFDGEGADGSQRDAWDNGCSRSVAKAMAAPFEALDHHGLAGGSLAGGSAGRTPDAIQAVLHGSDLPLYR